MTEDSAKEFEFSASPAMYAATRLIIEGLAHQGTKPHGTFSLPIGGGTPSRSNSDYFTGRIPWITVADLKLRQFAPQSIVTAREFITEDALEHSAAHLLPAGSIVLATRVSVGKVGIAQVPLATNQDFESFEPKTGISNRFLAYCLIASASKMQESTRGTTIKGIKREHLLRLELPFPDEIVQENIVRYLDAVSEKGAVYAVGLASKKLPLSIIDVPKTVARIELLADRIEEARNLRRQAMEEVVILDSRIRENIFNDLSANVGVQSLDMLSTKITDGEHITPRRCEVGYYLLSARNIQNNCIDLKNVDHVDHEEFLRIRKRCDPSIGDVLISCSGSIGKIAIVDESDSYVMVRSVAMVRPDQSRISPEFLAQAMRSQFVKSQMIEMAKSTAQANLFLGKIKSLKIPVPKMSEQHRIVAYLDGLQSKLDALKRHQAETAAELDALMPSILDRAFRGEL